MAIEARSYESIRNLNPDAFDASAEFVNKIVEQIAEAYVTNKNVVPHLFLPMLLDNLTMLYVRYYISQGCEKHDIGKCLKSMADQIIREVEANNAKSNSH